MRFESKMLRAGALLGLALMVAGTALMSVSNLQSIQILGAIILIATPTSTLIYIIYRSGKQKAMSRLLTGTLTLLIILLSIALALTL